MSEKDDVTWSLTESDPAVFSLLLGQLGVIGSQVEELWSLESEALDRIKFLFKYLESHRSDPSKLSGKPEQLPDGSWFSYQVVNNACATLAILNAVMNISSTSNHNDKARDEDEDHVFELGEELKNLKSFSIGLDPQTIVHNSFSRPDPFQRDRSNLSKSSEEAYHFITYVPIQGQLFELDGLNNTPICHGKVLNDDWLDLTRGVIESRIKTFSNSEVNFNLMAICGDRLKVLEKQRLRMISESDVGIGQEGFNERLDEIDQSIEQKIVKRKRWSEEVLIRRHNHIGFIHNFMISLAKSKKLKERIEVAKIQNGRI
ncbi:hypothetical protein BY996DRAFT_6433681 [Phakopsora pachyrhizi]|nr:hypothetical protein BY996DRAFT_6433681 [Phakopsora pachyrhizi]